MKEYINSSSLSLLNDSKINWCPASEYLQLEANSFSFSLPQQLFDNKQAKCGEDFKRMFNCLTKCLEERVWNANLLISANKNLTERAEEILRVAVGNTQLFLNKRMKQFGEQLERHLNPIVNQKPTLLDDLHGLWALIEMQLDDIRASFASIEKCRLNGWEAVRISSNIQMI